MQIVFEWFQPINLPATVLLILCLFYWLLVISGVLGMELFDLDVNLDTSIDGSMDVADISGAGLISRVFHFLHIGDVPFMIVFSIFSLFFWLFTNVVNHTWNANHDWQIGLIVFVTAMIGALGGTKLILQPFLGFFRSFDHRVKKMNEHVGETCIVDTADVSDKFGEGRIQTGESPVIIQIRNPNRFKFVRGDSAELVRFDQRGGFFEVRPIGEKMDPETQSS